MRRALVLTDESARHPFLASLPPHVRRTGAAVGHWFLATLPPEAREIDEAGLAPPPRGEGWRSFLSAYTACFAAVTVFFA